MQAPKTPVDEALRVEALRALGVLDTQAEARFDRLTRIAQHVFGVPIALVSLVDADRQWFKSRQGLDAPQTPRDISFCGHAILGDCLFVVPDAAADPRFADNPLVTGAPDIRFYAGAPLAVSSGQKVGTMCIIDRVPRQLGDGDRRLLRDLADCVQAELERTDLLRAQVELRQFKTSLDLINDCVFMFRPDTLKFFYVNRGAMEQVGYSAEEMRQMTPVDIKPLLDEAGFRALIAPLLAGHKEAITFETMHRHKAGRLVPVEIFLQYVAPADEPPRLVAIVRDISKRRRDELQLRSAENRLRAIIDTVVDGIVTIDGRGVVHTFNPAAERIFGMAADEVIGRNVKALMPEPYKAGHDGYLHNYLGTGQRKIIGIGREVTGRRKDGSTFPMDLAVSEMEVDGQRMFTGIVRDITERKRLERLKSEFVSTVSHELRTPLTSIRGALGLVLGKASAGLPDKTRLLLETANRNSERLTLLINDILDLEKVESGRLEYEFKTLDLAALMRQALISNEGYAERHRVRLRLVEAPESASVRGDEHRLLQVFANLLSNAVKYSPAGGEVELTARRRDAHFRVCVKDHGRGIPAAFRSRVFQRFAQADSSDTREKGGTGLGLSITKAIVEHHGGTIDYASDEGAGTEFYFDIPAWCEPRSAQAVAGRPLLLICEDNADVAMVLAELLAEQGLASDIAASAAAARQMLATTTYRALLLDLSLPDMDGLALIRELREHEATRQLPIIVVSGRATEGKAAWTGESLAVVDWLQKPVDQARLARALRQVLSRGERPSILHVEDDPDVIQVIQALVEDLGDYAFATTLAGARARLAGARFDLVLLDLSLPDGSGLELLEELEGKTPVVVFSGLEASAVLSQQVAAALTKSKTSNEQFLATIRQVMRM